MAEKAPRPKAEQRDAVDPAQIEAGLKAKAEEFNEKGGQIYLSEDKGD